MNASRRKRRWIRWCRYANRYLQPGLGVGNNQARLWNWAAERGWPWP